MNSFNECFMSVRSRELCLFTVILLGLGFDATAQTDVEKRLIETIEINQSYFIGEGAEFYLKFSRYSCKELVPTRVTGKVINATHVIARSGNDWYLSRSFSADPETVQSDVSIPSEPHIIVIRSGLELEHITSGRNASVNPLNPSRTNAFNWLEFARFNPVDFPRAIISDQGQAANWNKYAEENKYYLQWPWLPSSLRDSKQGYEYSSDPAGFVTAKSGWDEIRFDLNRGAAIVSRKTRFGPKLPWRCEINNTDFRQVRPGLWIPFQTDEKLYGNHLGEDEKLIDKVVAITKYRIEELSFDKVDQGLFEHHLPNGTMVVDVARDMHYQVTSEDDPFSSEVGQGRLLLDNGNSIFKSRRFILLATIALGAFLGLVIFWKWRSSKS